MTDDKTKVPSLREAAETMVRWSDGANVTWMEAIEGLRAAIAASEPAGNLPSDGELAMANERTKQAQERYESEHHINGELHRERQQIIELLGLGPTDAGYHDGFAWNLVTRLKERLAAAEARQAAAPQVKP